MRVLEALKILEDATIECKDRLINTPEVNEALAVIERHIDTEWRINSFRSHLERHPEPYSAGNDGSEGQKEAARRTWEHAQKQEKASNVVAMKAAR